MVYNYLINMIRKGITTVGSFTLGCSLSVFFMSNMNDVIFADVEKRLIDPVMKVREKRLHN